MNAPVSMLDPNIYWMRRALELARRGIGVTSPNPAVGCVILDSKGELIGEGWHEYDLRDHAEVMALKAAREAGKDTRGGTAFITLEPCCTTGRTPPCTDALIAARLSHVVFATIDPNPAVAGKSREILHAAGIPTSVGVCQNEARRLNEGFARWIQSRRPFVLMKVAMTLDARIAPPPGHHAEHAPYWITSEVAREAVQRLRWAADATMVGVDTVLADDPWLTDRSGLGRRRPLLRIVLDSALRMPLDSKLVKTAQNDVVIFTVSHDQPRAAELRSRGVRVEVLDADAGAPGDRGPQEAALAFRGGGDRSSSTGWSAGRVPLDRFLLKLGEEGVLTLLIEAGTRLNTAFLADSLVDRLSLFIAPQIMGSDAVPAFRGLNHFIDMNAMEIERYGNDLGLSSLLNDPWPQSP